MICSAVLVCVVAGTATAAPPDEASLQKALDGVVAAGAPGAVLLVRDGDRTIRLASGYSVLEGRVPARPDDRFRIGSVTKTFGYYPVNRQLRDLSVLSPTAAWAAGAIVSTADDVARFYRALLGGRLLRVDLLREMESTVPMGVPSNAYGLGLWRTGTMVLSRTPFVCGVAWGHNGDWIGYNTNAFNSKDGRRQFVLFVNRDEVAFTPEIAKAMFAVGSKAHCGKRG
jgi:CubicO group peptidase (beta-lactamase class C family)